MQLQIHNEICNINFVYYNLSCKILWMTAFILSNTREKKKLLKLQKKSCVSGCLSNLCENVSNVCEKNDYLQNVLSYRYRLSPINISNQRYVINQQDIQLIIRNLKFETQDSETHHDMLKTSRQHHHHQRLRYEEISFSRMLYHIYTTSEHSCYQHNISSSHDLRRLYKIKIRGK